MKLGMLVVMGTTTTHVVCRHQMRIYLFPHLHIYSDWLITKKIKCPEFCMAYIDETWYVDSDGNMYYPCGLSSPNVHV